jgi:hypothetical protein
MREPRCRRWFSAAGGGVVEYGVYGEGVGLLPCEGVQLLSMALVVELRCESRLGFVLRLH